jgi:hypothetical protein
MPPSRVTTLARLSSETGVEEEGRMGLLEALRLGVLEPAPLPPPPGRCGHSGVLSSAEVRPSLLGLSLPEVEVSETRAGLLRPPAPASSWWPRLRLAAGVVWRESGVADGRPRRLVLPAGRQRWRRRLSGGPSERRRMMDRRARRGARGWRRRGGGAAARLTERQPAVQLLLQVLQDPGGPPQLGCGRRLRAGQARGSAHALAGAGSTTVGRSRRVWMAGAELPTPQLRRLRRRAAAHLLQPRRERGRAVLGARRGELEAAGAAGGGREERARRRRRPRLSRRCCLRLQVDRKALGGRRGCRRPRCAGVAVARPAGGRCLRAAARPGLHCGGRGR